MRLHVLLIALALGGACATGSLTSSADTAADIDAARELFREGAKLAKEGNWGEAVVRYQRSLILHQSPTTLYSLGIAYEKLGKLADALESYRRFVAIADPTRHATYLEAARGAVEELEKRVAFVRIESEPDNPTDREVWIDGRKVPLEAEGRPRLLDPGEHLITMKAPGYRDTSTRLELTEGSKANLTMLLQPDELRRATFPVGPVVTMSLGAAALASGLAVGLIGVMEADDAPTRDGPEAADARVKLVTGDVLASAGAATAAVGIVWLALHLSGEVPSAQSSWLVSPGGVGVRF